MEPLLAAKKGPLKILIAIESQLRFIVFEDDCRHSKRPKSG